MVNICDMVIVEFVDLEKISGQTNKHTNKKQTNQRRRKDYSRRATITRTKQTNYIRLLVVSSKSDVCSP